MASPTKPTYSAKTTKLAKVWNRIHLGLTVGAATWCWLFYLFGVADGEAGWVLAGWLALAAVNSAFIYYYLKRIGKET